LYNESVAQAFIGRKGGHAEEGLFQQERTRAWIRAALYIIAGVIGCVIAPPIALTIFFALAVFYGFTSEGLFPAQRLMTTKGDVNRGCHG
jgi:hypothetical protein